MRNHAARPPIPDAAGVPIVGQSVTMICGKGHIQQLREPLTMTVGPAKIPICGVCWADFVQLFAAWPVTPEQLEAINLEALELGDTAPAGGG